MPLDTVDDEALKAIAAAELKALLGRDFILLTVPTDDGLGERIFGDRESDHAMLVEKTPEHLLPDHVRFATPNPQIAEVDERISRACSDLELMELTTVSDADAQMHKLMELGLIEYA